MVTIPTSRDVGRVGTRSGRIAPSGPTVSVGEGIAQFGNALTHVAYDLNDLRTQEAQDNQNKAGFDLETKIAQFRDAEEQSFLKAREEANESGIGFTRQFIEGYQQRANEFGESNFAGLNDAQKERAKQSIMGLGNSLYGKAYDYEQKSKTLFYDRTTNQGLDTVRGQIKNNAAPYDELKRQGLAAIDAADMPEAWKAERRALWESDAAESKWQWKFANDPQAAIREIKGQPAGNVVDKIIGVESGGNATAKNPNSSATGAGQFIASTWMNMVKKYRPDVAAGKSTPEILALRNDPALSREMTAAYTSENGEYLKNQGIETTDGNLYLAHFLGPGGASRVIKADPSAPVASVIGQDAVNANPFLKGKSIADLRAWSDKKMGGAGVSTEYDAIPYDRREQLANWGETQYTKQVNEERAAIRGQIEIAAANAPSAIANTGQYTGVIPPQDQFIQAYGAQDGARKYNELMAAVETGQQAYKMQTMPEAEINQILGQGQPTATGETAALEAERYQTLATAAQQVVKARNADPATYVQRAFPSVARAWEEAAVSGDYRPALTATAAAQQQLGIRDMRLLPKQLADETIDKFKDVNAPGEDRIAAVTGMVFSTSDTTQRRAIYEQLVNAGLPDATEGAMEAYARGDEGAGRRLMEAAIIDPSKLPGTTSIKPAEIDAEIQAKIMDDGQIGDIFYGLSDGTVENQERAIRDSKLLTNAVNLRVRNGETLDAAINGAAKDLYGDVKPVTGNLDVNAQILVPSSMDEADVLGGLAGLLPTVRSRIEGSMAVPAGISTQSGEQAITEAVRTNYIDNVMAEGYFRNAGDGYVFIDPYVGAAIAGPDGKPVVFTDSDVLSAPVPISKINEPPPEDAGVGVVRPRAQGEIDRETYGQFEPMLKELQQEQAQEPSATNRGGFDPGPIGGGGGY